MRIGIDARFLTHPQSGGFKTYTENLIAALAKLDRENEYFLYLDREPGTQDLIPAQSNFHTRVVSGGLPMLGFLWREQVQLPRQAARDRIDLFHAPCLTAPVFIKSPMVITVHDMIWAFPERFSQKGSFSPKRKFMEWYNYLVPVYATRRAAGMITVSQAAKDSILEYLKFSAEKIEVTWEAAQPFFVEIKDEDCFAMVRDR